MTPADRAPAAVLPSSQVAECLQTMVKALRAFQMYLPNNPIYQRATQQVTSAFGPIWAATDELRCTLGETEIVWEGEPVYQQLNRPESLAWALYKDGLRELILRRGCEEGEVIRFLETVNRARFLPAEAGDDLLTLLWEQEFRHIEYRFSEAFESEANLAGMAAAATVGAEDPAQAEQRRQAVAAEASPRAPGVVDIEDFDSTLYFLEEREVDVLLRMLEEEYSRDLRGAALAALLDIFETVPEATVRVEVLDILESLFPNLLGRGEFRVVAYILREIRGLARALPDLDEEQRARLEQFEAQLSRPEITAQLLQVLEETHALAGDSDVVEVLRELRPSAIETIVTWLPKISSAEMRQLLQASVERLAQGHVGEVLRLLRGAAPGALGGIIAVAGRLKLTQAVPALGDLLGHPEPAVRVAVVQALDDLGSPAALALLDRAIEDADRGVRLAAVRAAGNRGYRGALKRVESVVLGRKVDELDLTEKMAFFEAYGAMVGPAGVETLQGLLIPRGLGKLRSNPETRACAAMALGRIRSPAVRELLREAARDKELVVRNAATRALRQLEE